MFCVGCAIVKGDHAPDCGVAQGVIHGVVGHHGKEEEEVEEELGQEVERQEEENAQTPVRMTMTMDEMERHGRGLEPMWQCEQIRWHIYKRRAVCSVLRGELVCVRCVVHAIGHSGLNVGENVLEVVHNVP